MPTTLEDLTHWLMTKGLHIVVVVLFAVITTRLIRWIAGRISRRLTKGDQRDATTQSETVKHGQAVASVISSVAISVLYVVVAVDVANQLGLPLGSRWRPQRCLAPRWASVRNASCRICSAGFSSSPRSSTASETWWR